MTYDIDGHEMTKEQLLDLQSWLADPRGSVYWRWVADRAIQDVNSIDGEPDTKIHPEYRRTRIERILGQHAKIREVLGFAKRIADLAKQ